MALNFFILTLSLLLAKVHCNLEHLELINLKSWALEKQFKANYDAMVKDIGPKSSFSSFFGKIFRSKVKLEPQKDLDELSQLYGAMNSADTAALYFLSKECGPEGNIDPKTDPIFCTNYRRNLIKQIQNRIVTINARIIKSNGMISCPPKWAHHAITVESLLKDIDPKSLLEYRINSAITAALEPDGEGENKGTREELVEKDYAEQIAKAVEAAKAEEKELTAQADKEQTTENTETLQTTENTERTGDSADKLAPQAESQAQPQAESQAQAQPQAQPQTQAEPVQTIQAPLGQQAQPEPALPLYPSEQILNSVVGPLSGQNGALNLSIKL